MRSLLTIVLACAGLGMMNDEAAAALATVASGPAYGGPTQAVAVCYLYNAGPGNLSVGEIKIVREPDGVALPVVSNNCGTGFGTGGICRTVSNVNSGNVVACKATVSPKASARGSLEIRNATNVILNSRDVR